MEASMKKFLLWFMKLFSEKKPIGCSTKYIEVTKRSFPWLFVKKKVTQLKVTPIYKE